MRHVASIVVALTLCAAGAVIGGVKEAEKTDTQFDPAQSAALFVGVREFTHDPTLVEVQYAVDDAIDLAYLMSVELKPALVTPERVVLALSGEAQKAQSRRNLAALIAAGAHLSHTTHSDLLVALDQQARTVERNGVLIVAFATHGINSEGAQYLLASDSLLRHPETTISEIKVRDIASGSDAFRSLILLDACRQKLTSESRNGEPDPRSAAGLIRAMSRIHGQVVLSAAAAGEYAYDDDKRQNGVFTAAVIDGLRCAMKRSSSSVVTAESLATYVESRVLRWITTNRDAHRRRATQFTSEGMARQMPLAICASSRRQ
jgi:hypothetical protein